MKRKEFMKRCLMTMCLSISLVTASLSAAYGAELSQTGVTRQEVIEISNVKELLSLADNCKYDSFSLGKTVRLTADLDLTDVTFDGIPYFNGTFEGDNHKLSNMKLSPKGSDYGLFRYVGVSGTVKNLHITGAVTPTGSQENIGGIAGVNYGVIMNCSFTGKVSGIKSVGAIAGKNEADGTIISCSSKTKVLATNDTGGIVGSNLGVIMGCTNKSSVNIEELEPTLDLAGMDVSSFNMTQTVVSRNNMGGIAGSSTGLITDCKNEGTIGYKHTGYNAGGIVGSQCGVVTDCINQGEIFGRKDVGGIAGQAEPYVESEYLNDKVDATKSDINRLNRTLGNISSTMSDTSKEVRDYTDSLEIEYDGTKASPDEIKASISNELSSNTSKEEIKDIAETVDNGMQSIARNMESALKQMNAIANSLSDDIAAITSDEKLITDISSLETVSDMDGVISGCKNYGKIYGDLNVGGIAGTVNIEYDGDPEFDFDFSESMNITLRSTVNDVMIHCVNYGSVTAKKNCAGGISGLQELGFIYDCENYGNISSEAGSYLGGITGNSAAAVEKSYSLCNIEGTDYVGGVCGKGYTIKDSISVCEITSEGERVGGIAGFIAKEGSAAGNRFVSDTLHGVDNISYAGSADKVSYEDIMNAENIPDGFSRVTIVFEAEDEFIAEKEIPYGGSLTASDFPALEEKEGCYVKWPDEKELCDIRQNLTVTAEYVPWTESIAGDDTLSDGRAAVIAVGEFYEETKLHLTKTDGPKNLGENQSLAYAYTWNLTGNGDKNYDTITVHLAKPDAQSAAVSVWVKENDSWRAMAAEEDGSYLVAAIPYGAAVAVVMQPEGMNGMAVIAAAVVLLAAVVFFWSRKKSKTTAVQKKEKEKKKKRVQE